MRARNVGLTAGVSCSVGMRRGHERDSLARAHEGPDRGAEVGERRPSAPRAPHRRGRRRRGRDRRLAAGHRGAETAPDPVAVDRGTHPSPDRVRDARGIGGAVVGKAERHRADPVAGGPSEGLEGRTVADAPDQAESRFRPRARRARSTALPPRVRIRVRKPWVFARLRVLGWKVRFKATGLLEGHRADSEQGSAAGGGATECTGVRARMRNASAAGLRELPLVAIHSRCYVSSPRGATAGTRELPR